MRRKEVLARGLGDTMRKWKFEVLSKELLNVWTSDICGLLNFDDLKDLRTHWVSGTALAKRMEKSYMN